MHIDNSPHPSSESEAVDSEFSNGLAVCTDSSRMVVENDDVTSQSSGWTP